MIADDGFVRALFKEHERGKVIGANSIVRAPATLYWLMKIKVRSRMGQMQLANIYPELINNEHKNHSGGILNTLRSPAKWPKVIIYLYVSVMSRILARRRLRNISAYKWEKDITKNPDIKILISIDSTSFPLGTGPKLHEIWHSGYYPMVWINKKFKMIYLNMGHNVIDYEHKTNKELSSTFKNETQNKLVMDALFWLGGK